MDKNSNINLFQELSQIIEQGKRQVATQVNSTITITYWHIGNHINSKILQNKRAEYGKQIITPVAAKLVEKYGRSFSLRNLRRMMQFAEEFPSFEIVSPLVSQLSWSHFLTLFSVKNEEARKFYALKSAEAGWSKRELKRQIDRKVYERSEISNIENSFPAKISDKETRPLLS